VCFQRLTHLMLWSPPYQRYFFLLSMMSNAITVSQPHRVHFGQGCAVGQCVFRRRERHSEIAKRRVADARARGNGNAAICLWQRWINGTDSSAKNPVSHDWLLPSFIV
jgi:hypothetical protein